MARKTIHKIPMKARLCNGQQPLRKTFMIFTEGQTEEGYFKKFKVRCKTVAGGNALRIVEEAIVQKENVQKPIDQFWVVFDKDDTSKSDFLHALQLAKESGLNVAYSCDSFEIWWLFHFIEITVPMHRKEYEKKLQKYIPEYKNREKGLTQGERMWMQLDKRKEVGIANAKVAHTKYGKPEMAFHQSITTVYALVEVLMANAQY